MRFIFDIHPQQVFTLLALLVLVGGFSMVVASPLGSKPDPGHAGSELQDGGVTRVKIADNAIGNTELLSDAASLNKVSGGVLTASGSDVCINGACRSSWPGSSPSNCAWTGWVDIRSLESSPACGSYGAWGTCYSPELYCPAGKVMAGAQMRSETNDYWSKRPGIRIYCCQVG